MHSVETLVIGAGLVGSSVAMHLAELGMTGIRVVDFDLEGTLSGSELNAGGVRASFVQPVNIEMSKISIEYFAKIADEIGYRACGYLWLHSPSSLPGALKARETQMNAGWPVEAWDVDALKRRVPFIDKTDDLAGALFAPRDGLVNSNLLKNHFRAKARKLGVVFDDRRLAHRAEVSAAGVALDCEIFNQNISQEEKTAVLSGRAAEYAIGRQTYQAKRVVNCAGPWAPVIASMLGYQCPSRPVRRQVCIFDCREVDLTPYGMMIDTSGVYFHPEASNGLAGFANRNEPSGINFEYDGSAFFEELVWPSLYERSSKFERLRHLTGWSGLYEVSPDETSIIGEAQGLSTGPLGRIFEAHSFSGHGVMHSYGAGLALAELMIRGRYETLDAAPFSGGRFAKGQLLHEGLVI